MLRNSVIRTLRLAPRRATTALLIPRMSFNSTIRLNSNQADPLSEEQKKALHRQQIELEKDWDAKILTYEEFLPKVNNPSPDAYIIDVREPNEVIQGMIPSAVNLPLSVLSTALHLPGEEFKAKFGFNKPAKHQEITFYCRSGKRSSSAADVAKRNGYRNLYNYQGSWIEWISKQSPQSSA